MTGDATAALPTRLVGSWSIDDVDELAPSRARLHEALCVAMPSFAAEEDPSRTRLQNIVLAASELAANALEHAGGRARLDAVCDGGTVTISVLDRSPDAPPILSPDRELGAGGFGLQLTLRLADDVGWYRTPDGAKHVWARFVVREPEPADCERSPRG